MTMTGINSLTNYFRSNLNSLILWRCLIKPNINTTVLYILPYVPHRFQNMLQQFDFRSLSLLIETLYGS